MGAEAAWVPRARVAVAVLAALGWLGCLLVAAFLWGDWGSRPGWPGVALDLGSLAVGGTVAVALALRGPRLAAVPVALVALVWGWLGTWAYGTMWVPGAAALLGCALPRPLSRPVGKPSGTSQ